MLFNKSQLKIALLVIILIAAILLLRENTFFLNLRGYAYDSLVKLSPQIKSDKSNVTLISISRDSPLISTQWPELVTNIMQHKPAVLVIHFKPMDVEQGFYSEVQKYPNIYLLRFVREDPMQYRHYIIPPLPERLKDHKLNIVLSAYPRSENGIYRRQNTFLPIGDKPQIAYEFKIANALDESTPDPDGKDFLINFLAGNNNIPTIKSTRVLDGQLISELIKDKVVFLGETFNREASGFITPISNLTSDKMSLLEYQGFALDTVVRQKSITEFSLVILVIMLIVQITFSFLLYQWNRRYISLVITNSLIVVYIVLAWVLMHFYLLRLPLIELILVQFILHITIQRYKSVREEDELQLTLLEISAKNQEHVIPLSFYQSEDPWSQVIILINQTLNLSRLIFLERVLNDHRVREIKALNCDINDIHEMRRDYERTPYSTAIEAKGPIKIEPDKRQFLKHLVSDEEQYLVPLVFGGDVLGFWAFGITTEQLQETSSFLQHVNDYARQISELLYYRNRFLDDQHNKGLLQRYLRLSAKNSTQKLLNQTVEILNSRLDSLESVFHGISSATILYDLFGRVVQMNKQMESFIYERKIPAYDMTALDFVHKTIGMDISKIRRIIEQIIIEQRQFTMPLLNNEDEHHYYVLTLKPLKKSTEENFSDVFNVSPFQVLGILIELNDLSELKENVAITKKINEYMFYQLKNDMESLILATDMLHDDTLQADEKKEITGLLSEKANFTTSTINKFYQYINHDNNILTFEMYPIDASNIIEQTILLLTRQGIRDNITIQSNGSQLINLVIAETSALKNLLALIFEILIDDAMEDSCIQVEITDSENYVHINLFNVGFGLPDKEFQAYLFSDQPQVSKKFIQLRSFIQIIIKWGGQLSAHSNIGEGIKFTITLEKVFKINE